MAALSRKYHDKLQQMNLPEYNDPDCWSAREMVLQEIPQQQKLNDPDSPLHHLITNEQTEKVLRASKNGTVTRLDGIPYELWKSLHSLHTNNTRLNKPSFDVINCLRLVYNKIWTNRLNPYSTFPVDWMCLIYKKKDQTRIENYRPITLLNTDYQILTKALGTQLSAHACHLLHPDQTGFVPNPSIFDQIWLAELMCTYTDYMKENSAIIILDQEKVYNQIDHKYLLEILWTFHLPDLFTHTVELLYSHATTTVAINGIMSTPYKVFRGVWQGDPLSCLLFNLAMEPLAVTIRNSPKLNGFPILRPNQRQSQPIHRWHHCVPIRNWQIQLPHPDPDPMVPGLRREIWRWKNQNYPDQNPRTLQQSYLSMPTALRRPTTPKYHQNHQWWYWNMIPRSMDWKQSRPRPTLGPHYRQN